MTSALCPSPSAPVFTNRKIQATRPPQVKKQTRIYPVGARTPICGRPPPRKVFCSVLIRSLRPYVRPVDALALNAGQDGFRDEGSKQSCDPIEGHGGARSVPRRGSIDHTICSLSCKFWHRLSTVAVLVAPRVWLISRPRLPWQRPRISRCKFPQSASSSRRYARSCWPAPRRPISATCA
jgi:hypothetical protein